MQWRRTTSFKGLKLIKFKTRWTDLDSMKKLLEELYKVPTASLSDALDAVGFEGFMSHEIRPRVGNVKIVGCAITVKHVLSERKTSPLEALKAIDRASPGDIFVSAIDEANEKAADIALIGGLMALGAKNRGLTGAVIDGGIRDVAECVRLRFPVYSRSIVPSTTEGRTEVAGVNVPMVCGGVSVHSGDVIVGDDDGVVVIPRGKLRQVVEIAGEMEEAEKKAAEDLRLGRPLLETVKKYSRI